MARIFLSLSMYTSSNNHTSTAHLPVMVDWHHVVAFEMMEDPNTPGSAGAYKMFTEVTMDNGKVFKVRETPTEIWAFVQSLNGPAPQP